VNRSSEKVFGRIPALECLRARRRAVHRVYLLQSGEDLGALRAAAQGLPVEEVSRQELDRMTEGAAHQGVVLLADPLPVLRAEDWVRQLPPDDTVLVILDGVEDPHNFGAIVRSAAACGAVAVVFGKDRAAPVSPAAAKAAAGAMEHVDLVQATNLVRVIESLQKQGFWVTGLDAAGGKTLWETDLKGRCALVIGSEGYGLRRLVKERCDFLVRIPMTGAITSLNASVSAAIALYEALRQRQTGR
jgi:23S rRNA (guanosine2251-2'-O)-methyltransferase